jgi:hypothetical protein
MTKERQSRKGQDAHHQEGTQRDPPSERERRTTFSEVTIAAWTGEVSGQHLSDPKSGSISGNTSGMYDLDRALPALAHGGYVIDLRPLADHPKITSWVFQAPMPNGKIEGEDIDRLSEEARRSAADIAPGMSGAFQDIALLVAAKVGEPTDGGAGPFDSVSAAYRAVYWGSRGALIGKRVGNTLHWSDGRQQAIEGKSPRRARGGT